MLVMPYAEFGSLLSYLKIQNKMRPAEQELLTVYFCEQMLRCLSVLQTAHLIHGDIKPDNWVLRCHPGSPGVFLCLIDFGKSRPSEIIVNNNPIQVQYIGAYAARGMQSLPQDQPWGGEVTTSTQYIFGIAVICCIGGFYWSYLLRTRFVICLRAGVEAMDRGRVYSHGI